MTTEAPYRLQVTWLATGAAPRLALQVKANWRADKHPRDRRGRFIHTGAEVRTAAGHLSTVIGTAANGQVQIRDNSNGNVTTVDHHTLTVTKHPGGRIPTGPKGAPAGPEHSPHVDAPTTTPPSPHAPAAPAAPHAPTHAASVPAAPTRRTPPTRGPKAAGTPAADAVARLTGSGDGGHLPPEGDAPTLTIAQQNAIKQKWKLPKGSVADLQAQLAAVTTPEVPSVTDLVDSGLDPQKAVAEHNRLTRNAKTNEWRTRMKLQAAIDNLVSGDKNHEESSVAEVAVSTSVHSGIVSDDPATLDALLKPGDKPKALYPYTLGGPNGPGAVGVLPWHDALAGAGPNSDPVPVVGVNIQGREVHGWAQRINGRSYLVERRGNEAPSDAAVRLAQTAQTTEAVLEWAPADKREYQRGVAVLEGPNPADEHWAKTYNKPGFTSAATGGDGSTTFWGGKDPAPGVIAHEFGHNVDSQSLAVTKWISDPSSPGPNGTPWGDVAARDRRSSGFYTGGRYKETRPGGHPVTVGESAVSGYGASSPREDFAESVRLWMKDRREGKIGYDPTTGDNLRFADVFPERADFIDGVMGVTSDHKTAARTARLAEARAFLDSYWMAQEKHEPAPAVPKHEFGLPHADLTAVSQEARAAAKKKVKAEAAAAKEKAKAEAAAAAAKQQAEALKAKFEADAKAQVRSIQEALSAGLLTKADADKLRARRRAAKYHAKQQGKSEAEAEQVAAAFEQALIAKLVGGGTGPASTGPFATDDRPWVGKTLSPTASAAARATAHEWLHGLAGSEVHPLAGKQFGVAAQTKANIAAELGSRLNNEADFEAFRTYNNSQKGVPKIKSFDSYLPFERQDIMADAANKRVQQWAGTSGDTHPEAVMMQQAMKDEFGTTGHAAPRMTPEQFDKLMADQYAAAAPFYRRVARHMYENTQAEFKKAGITKIHAYRGMRFFGPKPTWAQPGTQRPQLQPINSWSTSEVTAGQFASGDVLLSATIPVELIVGTAATGFGCLSESEFVVMDADGEVKVSQAKVV